jgi:hypothetical protein
MNDYYPFYTSYYANIPNLDDYYLVSISGGITPDIEKVIDKHDKRMAPNLSLFTEYKETLVNRDISAAENEARYVKRFKEEVLKNLNIQELKEQYLKISHKTNKKIVFLCYEKPEDFCHRHIIAEALNAKEVISDDYKMSYYKYILANDFLGDF